jgi:hypothetical protein
MLTNDMILQVGSHKYHKEKSSDKKVNLVEGKTGHTKTNAFLYT